MVNDAKKSAGKTKPDFLLHIKPTSLGFAITITSGHKSK